MFVFAIAACNSKKSSIYEYPDDEPESKKGEVGDPCEKNGDCRDGLFCNDKVCSEPSATDDDTDSGNDGDNDDTDTSHDNDHTDTGSDDGGDTGHDNDHTDTVPDDGGDSGQDDDADSEDDSDTPERVPECGDGIKDPGEECDHGFANSDEPGDYGTCRTDCSKARCGDNIKDTNELCDDGNLINGDYCRSDCHAVTGYCGDGIEQINEACDSKNNPYCSSDCKTVIGFCGDGVVQSNEVCDNAQPGEGGGKGIGDYCSNNCKKIEGRCGDGVVLFGVEECDDGDGVNGTYGHCNITCDDFEPYCGDGIIHRENCYGYDPTNCVVLAGANEACDDGNNEDGDYCSADCQTSNGSCGDGKIQDFEICDKAKSGVGEGQGIGDYCRADCQEVLGRCGDETVLPGVEDCDEGDGVNGQRTDCAYGSILPCEVCNSACKKVAGKNKYCGDGIVSEEYYEVCDNAQPGTLGGHGIGGYCSSDCREILGSCGDGKVNRANCEGFANCVVTPGVNEACDPGIDPYCSSDCKRIEGYCGDGTVNGDEQCDEKENNGKTDCDYGQTSCKVCTNSCTLDDGTPHYCGDHNPDLQNGETCDEGSIENGGLNGTYKHCNSTCNGITAACSDGILQREDCTGYEDKGCVTVPGADEECDGNNGSMECPYGEESCTVCSHECKQVPGTIFHYCGDNQLDSENGEECDDGNKDDNDYCSSQCKITGSCGDGTVQGNEACDNADPNVGEGQGTGGYCSNNCQTVLGRCGDREILPGVETCDEGDGVNGTYSQNAPGHCNQNCNGYGEGGYCGDSTKQPEEECEHGGIINIYCDYGDKDCFICSADCTLEKGRAAYCDDGTIQREDCTGYEDKGCVVTPGANEECDDGEGVNGQYGGFCNSDCKGSGESGYCNDGILQREDCTGYEDKGCVVTPGANEVCDEGKDANGQYLHDKPGHCNYHCNGYGEGGFCGDSRQTNGETCDDGDLNGTYGHCNDNCNGYAPRCSDGILQRADCTGYEDKDCVEIEGANEECDDGSIYNGKYNRCDTTCSVKITCNDGILQREDCTGYEDKGCVEIEGANEECDEGKGVNGTYGHCGTDCQPLSQGGYCNDGILQREDCTGYEDKGCVVTSGANEECDEGEGVNGTYGHCGTDCQPLSQGGYCNDGILQREDCTGYEDKGCVATSGANEECDEGKDVNGEYGHCNTECTGISRCGDGIPNGSEVCDAGWLINGKYGGYCNSECSGWTGYCGDGVLQRTDCTGYDNCEVYDNIENSEECDDSSLYNGRYGHCSTSCDGMRPEKCGDGILQRENCTGYEDKGCVVVKGANEECDERSVDDGGFNGIFGHCDLTCTETVTWQCGDGNVDFEHGETCDEGDGVNGTYDFDYPGKCNSDCKGLGEGGYCNDGILQREDCTGYEDKGCVRSSGANEECDEGEGVNGTEGHCSTFCDGPTPVCGNGVVDTGEVCDEGESSNGKYGLEPQCNSNCRGKGEGGYCGDGKIQKNSEEHCGSLPVCNETTTTECCEVIQFAAGEVEETCDEGKNTNGYHGHCNKTCSGTSSCGDGELGKDEICDGEGDIEEPFPCTGVDQFFTGSLTELVSRCNENCMPIFTSCVYNNAYMSPFFKTMQTLCYNDSDEIACPAPGAAFYGQEPNFNYTAQAFTSTDIGATVTETVSGLVWQTSTPSSYDGCLDGTLCTLDEAVNYCENSTTGGHDDWRLPTAAEFSTIMDYASSIHIRSDFEDTRGSYWTSDGMVFSSENGTSVPQLSGTANVKCVRFIDSKEECTMVQCQDPDGVFDFNDSLITVYDKKGSPMPQFFFWHFRSPMRSETWENALALCEGTDIGDGAIGINKMRMPTVNELMSLIDRKNGGSLISGLTETVWTSTTSSEQKDSAYVVNFADGSVTTDSKTNSNIVICVE